jgi:UDP-2,4-diacetamido-2,4,6-trideoxy-beta-L-altropyranose hydrolase
MIRRIVARTDVTTEMGTGHLMRCRSLAQRLRDFGVSTEFLMAQCPEELGRALTDEGFDFVRVNCAPGSIKDANFTARAASEADWIIVDGYHFDSSYQKVLKSAGMRVLFIDDYVHCKGYTADIVLNQNMYANSTMYRDKAPHSKILTGPSYALLRAEFAGKRPGDGKVPRIAKNILVTLGGSDKDNLTARVVRALDRSRFKNIEVRVVVGAINQNAEEIVRICAESKKKMRVLVNIDNMAELMDWADLAISAGGTTAYELAITRTPSVMLVSAENQRLNAAEFCKRGFAQIVEDPFGIADNELMECFDSVISSSERRKKMVAGLKGVVDGRGPERVFMNMEGSDIWMRRAENEDSKMMLRWANDDETRKMSYTTAKISWETHAAWFDAKLKDPSCMLLIGMDRFDSPVGSARIESNVQCGTLSIIIDPKYRGKGYGPQMIAMACRMGTNILGLKDFDAFVKKINTPSLRAFEKCGFELISSEMIKGEESYHMTLEVSEE